MCVGKVAGQWRMHYCITGFDNKFCKMVEKVRYILASLRFIYCEYRLR